MRSLKNLGANDVYFWFMGSSGSTSLPSTTTFAGDNSDADNERLDLHEDLKINLIYPCTQKHITKYSRQGIRYVTETREIYKESIRPYMEKQREDGRLQWVWNIIDGVTEAEDVIYRIAKGIDPEHGFLLIPDLNWDRKTLDSLHLLALVERMDIWSLRDLKKKHIPWLKDMRAKILTATIKSYPDLEEDQLKCYVHYQPTYYHFHIHIVNIALEAGVTQSVGKAWGLDGIIAQLETMGGDEEAGMDGVDMSYTLGEASDLWMQVFEPLKKSKSVKTADGVSELSAFIEKYL